MSEPAAKPPPPKPDDPREPQGAVGWLLGPELIAQLGKILRRHVDPRSWMSIHHGLVHDEAGGRGQLIDAGAAAAGHAASADVVWFDYIADCGDSGDAMYAVAYALQIDLQLAPGEGATEIVPLGGDAHPRRDGHTALPRGQFLFVGGDTAYYIADEETIRARVQRPFWWAHDDVRAAGLGDGSVRRVYGIPGNHDWYDDLEGFAMAFRRADDDRHAPASGSSRDPAVGIPLPGLSRRQYASYVAIQLPHGWQLWGFDIDQAMDPRQHAYFDSLAPPGQGTRDPDRLILCTPSPAVAHGAAVATDAHRDAMHGLGLTEAYLPGHPLPAGKRRLDLSGDSHLYARYPAPDAADAATYQSVVSGLGGAFHHPSFTRVGGAASGAPARVPVREYPTPDESLAAIGPRLLRVSTGLIDSWFRALPFLFALLLGAAATAGGGATWLFGHVLGVIRHRDGGGGSLGQLWRAALLVAVVLVAYGLGHLALLAFRRTSAILREHPEKKKYFFQAPARFFDPDRSYWLSTWLAGAAVAAIIVFATTRFAPAPRTALLDGGALALLLVAAVILPWTAVGAGAPQLAAAARVAGTHRSPLRMAALGLVGLVHGVVQVVTPLVCALTVTSSWWTVAAAAVAIGVSWLMLYPSRPLFVGRRTLALAGLALATWAAGMAALCLTADRGVTTLTWWAVPRFAIGGGAAILLGTTYLVWYFALAGLLDGHNNEVGGAARVTRFREMIRFRVDARGVTGYVIAIEGGDAVARTPPTTRLIDVFSIATDAG